MEDVSIRTEYIKLDQFLKLADIVGTGGEARFFIADNTLLVNGEEEKRRGRKLRDGDTVLISGKTYRVVQAGEKA